MTRDRENHPGRHHVESPVLKGTVGPDVVDIRKFYAQTGAFNLTIPVYPDRELRVLEIIYIDGDEGVLLHVMQSATLPSIRASCKPAICCSTASCRMRRNCQISTTRSPATPCCTNSEACVFAATRTLMAVMCGVVGALSAFYPDLTEIYDPR